MFIIEGNRGKSKLVLDIAESCKVKSYAYGRVNLGVNSIFFNPDDTSLTDFIEFVKEDYNQDSICNRYDYVVIYTNEDRKSSDICEKELSIWAEDLFAYVVLMYTGKK